MNFKNLIEYRSSQALVLFLLKHTLEIGFGPGQLSLKEVSGDESDTVHI